MVFNKVSLTVPLLAINCTLYKPEVKNSADGFWLVDVLPLPKFQVHEVGLIVDSSVKFTTSGGHPATLSDVKFAAPKEASEKNKKTGSSKNFI